MKGIFEIRLHGRGGQGAKTASQFIAEAGISKGKHIQSFPEYGPERAGAPVKAFARISDNDIKTTAPVTNPDVVLVIDATLLDTVDVAQGLSESGILIVNTPKDAAWLKEKTGFGGKCMAVDATKIALEAVGKNLPNTPILGALVKATGCIELEAISESIRKKFEKKLGEQKTQATIDAVKRAYDEVG
ncbi:pyruvate synthase [Candidatus Woesearchaeota archaeon]|nr:pyruvate synthase [Candidatus Woesearchaeota archaeon]